MSYKHSVKDKIKQASNYYLGTWFCESESERRYKKKLQEANIDFSQQVVIGNRRVDFLVNGTEIHEINGHYHYSDSQRKKDLERKSPRAARIHCTGGIPRGSDTAHRNSHAA